MLLRLSAPLIAYLTTLLLSAEAFTISRYSSEATRPALNTFPNIPSIALYATNSDNPEKDKESESTKPSSLPPPMANPVPQRTRMDPLVASLTRSDSAPDQDAPILKVPLLGEVTLDKTLFVLLPVVAFAVLGGLASIYVAAISGDAVSQAWDAYETAISSPAGSKLVDPNVCRGLCSDQDRDLQGLANYMNNIAGKK
jgi:hypothetical protein